MGVDLRPPVKALVVEWAVRIVLCCICSLLEHVRPFQRAIRQEELLMYKHPHLPETLPTPLLVVTAVGVPLAFIVVHYLATGDKYNLMKALLGLSLATLLSWLIHNILKVSVGRPRPDFYYRCFPDGQMTEATSDLQCSGDPAAINEGLKSFPSGHTGWMFSCFGFLSLYLSGKLQCFRPAGRGQAWRLCVVLAPLLAACLVGTSRLRDNKHHPEDIAVGGVIGFLSALVCYHQYFPSPFSPNCDSPHPPLVENNASVAAHLSLIPSGSRSNLRKMRYTGPEKLSDLETV